ncbi:MAG: rRNA pseudouridine synthase [Ruminococcus sp.]|nr:rRNA pseudouridine synthase [Ruminococcus sp.]
MEKIRLQKIIAESGLCSRRKAEELIASGAVKVNGRNVKVGDGATIKDIITVNGVVIRREKHRALRYIMLNKPRGYVTTMNDELDRKNVTMLLGGVDERVYPIGRLDKDTEGLLLFTNDGKLAQAIMHPSREIAKSYRVTVREKITEEQLTKLSLPMKLNFGTPEEPDMKTTVAAHVEVLLTEAKRTVLLIVIREGKNRQIRRMCEAAGLTVVRLKRIAEGPLKLGMLKPGTFRDLTPAEVIAIKNAVK